MRKLINAVLATLVVAGMQSCTFIKLNVKSGNWSTTETVAPDESRTSEVCPVADFTKVEMTIPANVTYSMTEGEASVEIDAPENYHERIKCDVVNGELFISVEDGKKLSPKAKIRVRIASSTLTSVTIKGAADFSIPDGLVSESFSLLVQGAADADVNGLKCSEASVTIQGAGDIDVSGIEAVTVECLIQGAGDISLSGQADTAKITLQGAGDIDIDDLDVRNIETNIKHLSKKR